MGSLEAEGGGKLGVCVRAGTRGAGALARDYISAFIGAASAPVCGGVWCVCWCVVREIFSVSICCVCRVRLQVVKNLAPVRALVVSVDLFIGPPGPLSKGGKPWPAARSLEPQERKKTGLKFFAFFTSRKM